MVGMGAPAKRTISSSRLTTRRSSKAANLRATALLPVPR